MIDGDERAPDPRIGALCPGLRRRGPLQQRQRGGQVCAEATADPGGWRALRGAMGSTFRVPITRAGVDRVLEAAGAHHVQVAATAARDGTALSETSFVLPTLILLGNEGAGLPPAISKRADQRIRIPMRDGVNSLNVGVAAALILYEAARQRGPGI